LQVSAAEGRLWQVRANSARAARPDRARSEAALKTSLVKIMMSCGEPSGDLYAGALAVEIRRRDPAAAIFGLGGQRLMAGGGELAADYHGLTVTGLVEALSVVPRSFTMIGRLTELARTERPDVAVVIDFPDFHLGVGGLGLAPRLKALGIPVVYYIPAQLWALRRKRL